MRGNIILIDKENIIKFFNSTANSWDENGADVAGALCILSLPQIKKAIRGAKVLDVGCGTGVMTAPLLQAGAASITGIDLSEKMVDISRGKFEDEHVQFCVGDIWAVDEKFDVVMMYNVYPHISNHKGLAEKLAQILLPGGRFVIAHGDGKDGINKHHKTHACQISSTLGSAEEEASLYSNHFNIDVLIDKPDIYCISGVLI